MRHEKLIEQLTKDMAPVEKAIFIAHEIDGVSFSKISEDHPFTRQCCQQKNASALKKMSPVEGVPGPSVTNDEPLARIMNLSSQAALSGIYYHKLLSTIFVRQDVVPGVFSRIEDIVSSYHSNGVAEVSWDESLSNYALILDQSIAERLGSSLHKSKSKSYLIRASKRDKAQVMKTLSVIPEITIDDLYGCYLRYAGRSEVKSSPMNKDDFKALVSFGVDRWGFEMNGSLISSGEIGSMSYLSRSERLVYEYIKNDEGDIKLSDLLAQAENIGISKVQISKTVNCAPFITRKGHGIYAIFGK